MQALSSLSVWILDAPALGRQQAHNPLILEYANPCTTAGVLSALMAALFPPGHPVVVAAATGAASASDGNDGMDGGGSWPRVLSNLNFKPGGRAWSLVDARFYSLRPGDRDALRQFLSDSRHLGQVDELQLTLLKALPIYPVHGDPSRGQDGEGGGDVRRGFGGGARKYVSVSGSSSLFLAPRGSDPALLGQNFACEDQEGDGELLEVLGVRRVNKPVFFREHVLSRVVDGSLPPVVRNSVVASVLSNLEALCQEDPLLKGSLLHAPIVLAAGGGEGREVLTTAGELYDPSVQELRGLLGEEAFPAENFCSSSVLAGLRELGLRDSLTCEGVLLSARSIESALVDPGGKDSALKAVPWAVPPNSEGHGQEQGQGRREAQSAALERAQELVVFVNHRAKQLLTAAGPGGQWLLRMAEKDVGWGHGRDRGRPWQGQGQGQGRVQHGPVRQVRESIVLSGSSSD
ncbi:unnamed protein product, partial [Discosporangium mesarthrocarpum]